MEDIGKIFQTALEHVFEKYLNKHGDQASMARKAGIPPAMLNDILKGRRGGTEEGRRALATALGYPGPRYEDFLQIGRNILAGRDPESGDPTHPSDEELNAQGFMKVDFSEDMKLAAGGGGEIPITDLAENSKIVVHRSALGQRRYHSKQLRAFRVGGDSMEPVIAAGGIVLADLTKTAPPIQAGDIYVLRWDSFDGECAVKYLRWAEEGRLLSIESANPYYKPVFKDVNDIALIGRVILAWRKF